MKNKKIGAGFAIAALATLTSAYISKKMVDKLMGRTQLNQLECFDDAKKVQVLNDQNQMLCGYLYSGSQDLTFIIMHPCGLSSQAMLSYVRYFKKIYDCHILVVDQLSHGNSEGKYKSLGFSNDIIVWVNYLISNGHKNIFLYGKEMGANSILNYNQKLQEYSQVKAIISDGAYSNVRRILKYRLHKDYCLLSFPFIFWMRFLIKVRYHIDLYLLDTLKLVRQNTIPTLFVHTQKDVFVPLDEVFKLYNASKGDKELLVLKKGLYLFDLENETDDEYLGQVKQFVDRYLK